MMEKRIEASFDTMDYSLRSSFSQIWQKTKTAQNGQHLKLHLKRSRLALV